MSYKVAMVYMDHYSDSPGNRGYGKWSVKEQDSLWKLCNETRFTHMLLISDLQTTVS